MAGEDQFQLIVWLVGFIIGLFIKLDSELVVVVYIQVINKFKQGSERFLYLVLFSLGVMFIQGEVDQKRIQVGVIVYFFVNYSGQIFQDILSFQVRGCFQVVFRLFICFQRRLVYFDVYFVGFGFCREIRRYYMRFICWVNFFLDKIRFLVEYCYF